MYIHTYTHTYINTYILSCDWLASRDVLPSHIGSYRAAAGFDELKPEEQDCY